MDSIMVSYLNPNLRPNQKLAVSKSIEEDFLSGCHNHATGAGKSWIALEIIHAFHNKYPKKNVYWICERKSILNEQFNHKTLRLRGYSEIYQDYHILNYTNQKSSKWYESVNVSPCWGKPVLIIINRAFLTSMLKYERVKIPFGLVIHDECHSISNKSTQKFYNYLLKVHPDVRCLGFSATPKINHKPYDKLISHYSIYDGVKDNVIVAPKIKWIKSRCVLGTLDIICLVKNMIEELPYQKIVVWAGIIEMCLESAKDWKPYFPDFNICLDTSRKESFPDIGDFDSFNETKNKAILFCACKHREGSDIQNLDACVFLDGVEKRSAQTFVQCVGRVLRKDQLNLKQSGLILDLKANSSIKICDRMTEYFRLPSSSFPWIHTINTININSKSILVNTLLLDIKTNQHKKLVEKKPNQHEKLVEEKTNQHEEKPNQQEKLVEEKPNLESITKLFIRECPKKKEYLERLEFELNLINSKNLGEYLAKAVDILNLTKNIPHVTRGSCGSSLVCYLLGISHTDPVFYGICFSRFLNEFRDNLPDIDFDFPYNLRDDVFFKIAKKWPGCVARISNHVYYHDKSALREAVRKNGIREFIPKDGLHKKIRSLSSESQKQIQSDKNLLKDTFKCYSLHCGGIVYYPEGVPQDLKLNSNKSTISQIVLNKKNVAEEKKFKIDILSSRGLAQLHEIVGYQLIDFTSNDYDRKTSQMLSRGENIGICLAESPLMRKAFLKIQPKCIKDIAICLSIIRPMASENLYQENIPDLNEEMVFDDDAIKLIVKALSCSEGEADRFRRGFTKGKKKVKEELKIRLSKTSNETSNKLVKKLKNLAKYSFCKSHAYSYAQLVWQLAYYKAHHPVKFWKACLNHCDTSYRKWVHLYEASKVGIEVFSKNLKKNDKSIYSKARYNTIMKKKLNDQGMFKATGHWNFVKDLEGDVKFYPNCYAIYGVDNSIRFRGIIASYRVLNKKNKIVLFLGVTKDKYLEITSKIQTNIINYQQKIGAYGQGVLKENSLECESIQFF